MHTTISKMPVVIIWIPVGFQVFRSTLYMETDQSQDDISYYRYGHFANRLITGHPSGHYWDYCPGALPIRQVIVTRLKIGHPFNLSFQPSTEPISGNILCMCPANERWRYIAMSSLIGWAHTQKDPCNIDQYYWHIIATIGHEYEYEIFIARITQAYI